MPKMVKYLPPNRLWIWLDSELFLSMFFLIRVVRFFRILGFILISVLKRYFRRLFDGGSNWFRYVGTWSFIIQFDQYRKCIDVSRLIHFPKVTHPLEMIWTTIPAETFVIGSSQKQIRQIKITWPRLFRRMVRPRTTPAWGQSIPMWYRCLSCHQSSILRIC